MLRSEKKFDDETCRKTQLVLSSLGALLALTKFEADDTCVCGEIT